jgi:hypothetical protein
MAPNRRTQDRSAKSLAKLRIALAKRNEKTTRPLHLQTVGVNRDYELHDTEEKWLV